VIKSRAKGKQMFKSAFFSVAIGALILTGCGDANTPAESDSVSLPTAPTVDVPTLSGDYVVQFKDIEVGETGLTVPDGLVASSTPYGIVLSGQVPDAFTTGRTAGAYLTLDGDDEASVSGHDVVVNVVARSEDGGQLKVAYSTSEVGNSGWNDFALTENFEVYSFDYKILPLKAGAGDYIGLLPVAGSAEIASLSIDIK
jgi:hypothetical protein